MPADPRQRLTLQVNSIKTGGKLGVHSSKYLCCSGVIQMSKSPKTAAYKLLYYMLFFPKKKKIGRNYVEGLVFYLLIYPASIVNP